MFPKHPYSRMDYISIVCINGDPGNRNCTNKMASRCHPFLIKPQNKIPNNPINQNTQKMYNKNIIGDIKLNIIIKY